MPEVECSRDIQPLLLFFIWSRDMETTQLDSSFDSSSDFNLRTFHSQPLYFLMSFQPLEGDPFVFVDGNGWTRIKTWASVRTGVSLRTRFPIFLPRIAKDSSFNPYFLFLNCYMTRSIATTFLQRMELCSTFRPNQSYRINSPNFTALRRSRGA